MGMGVQLYLLDRRRTSLDIGGTRHLIGTLRRSWKLTEIDTERAAEIAAVAEDVKGTDFPLAAMAADVIELPLLNDSTRVAAAHMVIGWEPGRYSVTDMAWDFLPALGFAVRSPVTTEFVLHEERDAGLIPMTFARALEASILDGAGRLLQHGQPTITKCLMVKPFIQAYAIANCELADGRTAELVTRLSSDGLPPNDWYIGKLPSQIGVYPGGDITHA